MTGYRLTKNEKLCSKTTIERLFAGGSSFVMYPFRVVYNTEIITGNKVDMFISVPKRNFKRAVKRNMIRRKSREAYRLNKNRLIETVEKNNITLHIALLYIAKEIEEYSFIEKKMKESLLKLTDIISKLSKADT